LIPVSVVTGFLGSGKTSLIRRVLTQPGFGRTAVIVNEFGEISLDHDLIASSDETVLTLSTGCLCCAVQTDLARTLMELMARRENGSAVYDRVLIETSGLGNPGPMIQTMLTDRQVATGHRLETIVTLVDSVFGMATLAEHAEAREQVALADVILASKQDLRPLSAALLRSMRGLNPTAPLLPVADASAAILFGGTQVERHGRLALASGGHRDIETFTLVRDRPLSALALTLLLQALAEHCGPRLLRLKGLVALEEMLGRPAVIHGVRHVFSAPEFLDRWPGDDRTTRIVFIGRGIPRYFVHRLLSVIEEEVRDTEPV
jgi:G3E family GTPase